MALAGDQPFAALAVPALLAATDPEVDAVLGVDESGRDQRLLAAYRLSAAVDALDSLGGEIGGRAMAALLDHLRVGRVRLPAAVTVDVDDPESLARARARVAGAGQS